MARHPDTMKSSRQRPPTFFWQGVLIVLPVVVLAGAAVISLRQDRILAHHEAAERAEALAQQTADALWAKLTAKESLEQFRDHTFRVDAAGRLVFPPPAPPLPVPQVLDASVLNASQRESWGLLKREETAGASPDGIIEAGRRFLAATPPDSFAAIARFRLAQELAARGSESEAVAGFAAVRDDFPEALGESGLPLRPLAELGLLELSTRNAASNAATSVALNTFCSNLVNRPSFLTSHLLTRAVAVEATLGVGNIVEPWQREWERRLSLRHLADAALKDWATADAPEGDSTPALLQPVDKVPALSWFDAPDLAPSPQPIFRHIRLIRDEDSPGRSPRNALATFMASDPTSTNPVSQPPQASPTRFDYHTGRRWLATRLDDGKGGFEIVCRAMGSDLGPATAVLGSPAWMDLRNSLPPYPPWLGATIDLAGVPLLTTNDLQVVYYQTSSKGSGQALKTERATAPQEILATASRIESGLERLRVNVHLVSRDLLFGRQRTRSYLFGLLVAASAVAALVGFVSARRAFTREHQLSAMKSNFVSSVSHELRAPIASVRLLAESLERGRIAEPAKQNEYFRFIVQECRRLSSLIENVLDFARIEQGRKQYEFEPADVRALVGKTVQLLEPVAAEKKVALRIVPSGDDATRFPPPVLDAAAIQQALVNLLDNAVKHSPSGSEVTVGLDWCPRIAGGRSDGSAGAKAVEFSPSPGGEGGQPIDSTSDVIRLWVQDRGRGIPVTEHERIFERFYRPGSEMRRETQGVGIGLSIVKHIVEAHGGRVWVESEIGQGSRFIVELPMQPKPQRT
jgi:signal transduction histidine kinase